ncbi:MAG: hypothetical protein AAB227_02475 [Pseudomonadota bacterium]
MGKIAVIERTSTIPDNVDTRINFGARFNEAPAVEITGLDGAHARIIISEIDTLGFTAHPDTSFRSNSRFSWRAASDKGFAKRPISYGTNNEDKKNFKAFAFVSGTILLLAAIVQIIIGWDEVVAKLGF